MMLISVIIPTLNEASHLPRLLTNLKQQISGQDVEILVVDGGSTDRTPDLVRGSNVRLVVSPKQGRAYQLNLGAQEARGDLFYFLHADVVPPPQCFSEIKEAVQAGRTAGCFSYRFDSDSWLLRVNAWFTRFNLRTTGGGDQGLFITRSLFSQVGRFDESLLLMEDFDFVWRLKKKHPFHIIRRDAIVSARKYENNSYVRVQIANLLVFVFFQVGISQAHLRRLYQRLLQ
jgi:rSAM/selenodomain-associated transferase 2